MRTKLDAMIDDALAAGFVPHTARIHLLDFGPLRERVRGDAAFVDESEDAFLYRECVVLRSGAVPPLQIEFHALRAMEWTAAAPIGEGAEEVHQR